MTLRVGRILDRSAANGPGERFTVWTQGCSLRCRGCFNPELWDPEAGSDMDTAALAAMANAAAAGLRGVTISGGEPLEQPEAVADLLSRLAPRLDSVLFTGFSLAEVDADPARAAAAARADLVVAGRYSAAAGCHGSPWRGAPGKELRAATGRIRPEEAPACEVEAHVLPDGSVRLTGFPDEGLLSSLRAPSRCKAPCALQREGALAFEVPES